jgi:hypothetical protein
MTNTNTATWNTPGQFIGQRVRIWQPVPMTSKATYIGTLDHATGSDLYLTDVEIHRDGEPVSHQPRPLTFHYNLNWNIEAK